MASVKNFRKTAAQVGYAHKNLDSRLLRIRKSSEEIVRVLDAMKKRKK